MEGFKTGFLGEEDSSWATEQSLKLEKRVDEETEIEDICAP